MKVENGIYYHYHAKGVYDEVWTPGNEFIVDDKWESHLCRFTDKSSIIVKTFSDEGVELSTSFDKILKRYLVNRDKNAIKNIILNEVFDHLTNGQIDADNVTELTQNLIKRLTDLENQYVANLEKAAELLEETSVAMREIKLEEYRKNFHPELPSRLHSIWFTDPNCLEFWEDDLHKNNCKRNLTLYRLQVNGNVFKSRSFYLPRTYFTEKQMYDQAKFYWEPAMDPNMEYYDAEYLFQGKVKILEKVKK